MARASDGTDGISVTCFEYSPNGLLPDLKEQDTVPARWRKKINETSQKSQSCHHSFRVYPGSKTSYDAKITNIEQIISCLAARVNTLETVVPARGSWNILGHSDDSTATGSLGSHGPGSSDDNRNTRRGFDIFQTPRTNMCEVPSCHSFRANNTTLEFPCGPMASGKSPTCQPTINLSGFIAKQVVNPPDSCSTRELNVRTSLLMTRTLRN